MKQTNNNSAIYSFEKKYILINNFKMNYIDEGNGECLLFVHGTPSWSYDFRNVIKVLSLQYRCIAIDHIGFGLSEKPKNYDYSTENHSKTFRIFIEQLNLTNITLIVHDFGGPIALRVAIDLPNLFCRLVVLNSWLWSSQNEPEFKKLRFIIKSPLTPILYKFFNFSPKYLLPMSFGESKLGKIELVNYLKPFKKFKERNGPLAFAYSLINDQNYFESIWQKKATISKKPTLFIWGMSDKFVTSKYLDKFSSEFSNKVIIKLFGVGHFPQEEASDKVANGIKNFIELSFK